MKQNRWSIAVVALLVVGAIVLGGCGGGEAKRLTKAEFAAKANALCSAYQRKGKALGTPNGTAESAASVLGKAETYYENMFVDLKKLQPPTGEQVDVDQLLTISEEQLALGDRVIAALKKNDWTSALRLVKKNNALDTEVNRIFHQLGVTACDRSQAEFQALGN